MDAIELGRQSASALHAELVAEGCDPWNPMALVEAEAKRRGIDIEAIALGSPVLNNTRANFDPVGRTIQHEQTGDPFINAFLIAHELGHVALGDDRLPHETVEADPSRPSEAAPVGEERVVDYSRKQRREVQMDLFARELLLPRSSARALHVDQAMGARAIATRLGGPYAMVAQQLLDALLLPAAEEDDEKSGEWGLNDKQGIAASHRGRAFLLEAGPGTGKTQTLVARVAGLIDDQIDPRTIVVLTYSNKAAGELSGRIAARNAEEAAAMWVGTFHAFGLDLIHGFHRELGYEREPRLLDRTEAIEFMEIEVTRLSLEHYRDLMDPSSKLRDLLGAVSRAQDEVVSAEEYEQLAQAMSTNATSEDEILAAEKAMEVAKVYRSYDRIKRATGRIDFGDLVALPVRLLESRPDIAATLRAKYHHILVDEYQDVNHASVRLLKCLTDAGKNLWCVGDARQSIYRFRGASSFNLARFDKTDFPLGKRDRLEINYRSRKEIADAYSNFASDMHAGRGSPAFLTANRGPSGNPVEFQSIVGEAELAMDALVDAIEAMRKDGHRYRDQALLCSGNDRLAKIGAGLEARGIPVLYLGSIFERPEVKDLLAWLSLFVDRRAMGLVRGTDPAGLALSLPDAGAMMSLLTDNLTAPLGWMSLPAARDTLSPEGMDKIAQYAAFLKGFTPESAPWESLCTLMLDRSRVAADIAAATNVAARARGIAIWQFMNFVRAQPPGDGLPVQRLLDRVRRLVQLSDDRDLRQIPDAAKGIDALRLMTMHGSKGLEFPVVHIPGMNVNTLPRSPQAPPCPPPDGLIEGAQGTGRAVTDAEHREEQECLFYVALSRAKDRLALYAPTKTVAGAKREPSPFIDRLGAGLNRVSVQPEPRTIVDDDAIPVDIRFVGNPAFTQAQLSLYERCPRRFFYTHIVNVGGRRTSNAFMDMHDVVRTATRSLIDNPGCDTGSVALDALLETLWQDSPAAEAGHSDDLRAIARSLIGNFVADRAQTTSGAPHTLRVTIAGVEISVDVEDVQVDASGATTLRQVRTGHKRSTEMKGAAVAAFQIAANTHAGGSRVELFFLADNASEQLILKDSVIATRRKHLENYVQGILAGAFPTKPSDRSCPKCPAFFICGPAPAGAMEKNFPPDYRKSLSPQIGPLEPLHVAAAT
jgi:superfamily I DNA/RNA helicase